MQSICHGYATPSPSCGLAPSCATEFGIAISVLPRQTLSAPPTTSTLSPAFTHTPASSPTPEDPRRIALSPRKKHRDRRADLGGTHRDNLGATLPSPWTTRLSNAAPCHCARAVRSRAIAGWRGWRANSGVACDLWPAAAGDLATAQVRRPGQNDWWMGARALDRLAGVRNLVGRIPDSSIGRASGC